MERACATHLAVKGRAEYGPRVLAFGKIEHLRVTPNHGVSIPGGDGTDQRTPALPDHRFNDVAFTATPGTSALASTEPATMTAVGGGLLPTACSGQRLSR